MSNVVYQTSDIRCLMWYVRCLISDVVWCGIWRLHQTSEVLYQMCDFWCSIADVWCLMWYIRCLMSGVWWGMTDVWCLMSYVSCGMSDVWCGISDIRCLISDVWCSMSDCRLVSSVGYAPVCWAGGLRFKPQQDQHSGSLNNLGGSAAFVITSANGLTF